MSLSGKEQEVDGQMSEQPSDYVEQPAEPSPQGDQSELDLGVVNTGDPVVDEALSGLEQLKSIPVAEHPEVFEQVHRGLTDAMTRAGDEPDQPEGSADATVESHGADQ